ncbi:MAG: hypothetical protein ACE5IJ_09580 [Thermoplasmata archaeon]
MVAEELTRLFLEEHKAIVKKVAEERGHPPRKYKKLEPRKIERLFSTMRLDGLNLLDQAMKLLSGLIVSHALPNANHRTSIFFVQFFLEENGLRFPFYRGRRAWQRQWRLNINSYIRDSKYLLRLKYKPDECAERYHQGKPMYIGGSKRVIRREDLGLSKRQYNRRHRQVTRDWLESMLQGQSTIYLKIPEDSLSRLIARSGR